MLSEIHREFNGFALFYLADIEENDPDLFQKQLVSFYSSYAVGDIPPRSQFVIFGIERSPDGGYLYKIDAEDNRAVNRRNRAPFTRELINNCKYPGAGLAGGEPIYRDNFGSAIAELQPRRFNEKTGRALFECLVCQKIEFDSSMFDGKEG